jgi:hypothetical protein
MTRQLVGSTCLWCRERISSIVEGRFCGTCGNPFHDACREARGAPGQPGRCPACGYPAKEAISAYASDLVAAGTPAAEMQSRLVEIGLDQKAAAEAANEALIRAADRQAAQHFGSGLSPAETQGKLVECGFDQQVAMAAVGRLVERQSQDRSRRALRRLAVVVGALFLLAGMALFIGNRSGAFPTVPFAGFIVMGLGGAILASAGARS